MHLFDCLIVCFTFFIFYFIYVFIFASEIVFIYHILLLFHTLLIYCVQFLSLPQKMYITSAFISLFVSLFLLN